jgi:hypothetical protein
MRWIASGIFADVRLYGSESNALAIRVRVRTSFKDLAPQAEDEKATPKVIEVRVS